MNTFRVIIVSLLAFSVSFAHASYIPTERDASFNPVSLLPSDPRPPASSSSSSSLRASNAPPYPSSPPSLKLPSPLPAEQNGVLLNGTVINPNADNYPNATKSAHSCWTKPVKPAVPMEKDDFSPGQCQACVTRWDTGADPVFQFWIRDAHNHAMGEMKATPWSSKFDTYLTVPAGNGLFNLTEIEFLASGTSGVYMSWQANTELVGGQMAFEPSSIGSPSIENCTFSGSTESGAVTHFQCHFECSA